MNTYKGKLNKIREEKRITQSELAVAAGVPQPYISRFDKSEQHNIKNLFAVANALNLKIDELFEPVETPESK
ncbi:helix-turn-helix transcriptional regulator [Paenibacillus sp. MER 99-2]|uniref:helix-turn-helix domain-containing protein n=1 Tax=Paenibacillus sp. MER 99-2 TaxID=2939572 RepID=UPI002040E3D8|nr:helix-turn-helix domain-containing protein [Paenibacillus sp. MER 99-2]